MELRKWLNAGCCAAITMCCTSAWAWDNGMARTPPMGWNTWNKFGCDVSEKLVRDMADTLVRSGMRDAGYDYLVLDDCWQVGRDADTGEIVVDSEHFPAGIGALTDYVHSRGLKMGIYTDAGTKTCKGRPGSLDHEAQDMRTYAGWGIDYVKVDWCYTQGQSPQDSYTRVQKAIQDAGRDMVLSVCNWGHGVTWTWADSVGHMWRTTDDIADRYDAMMGIFHANSGLYRFAKPGAWNDPDMLEVGNGGMTDEEYRTHFSLWAMQAAPLMAGNDLRSMSAATRDILLNREVIAVDQDALGVQAHPVASNREHSVWVKELADGGRAVLLLNEGSEAARVTAHFDRMDLSPTPHTVRDVWRHADLGNFERTFAATVPPHGVVMVTVH